MSLVGKFNQSVNHAELGKFILRVSFAAMFLLHGIHKIGSGTDFIQSKFAEFGLPGFLAYAVYLGEVIAPILISYPFFRVFMCGYIGSNYRLNALRPLIWFGPNRCIAD